MSLNKVILMGNMCADPELKQTQGGVSVSSFNIAVNRKYSKDGKAEVDFITIVAWRQQAEFICKYFKKGQAIVIVGELQTRNWTDNQGNKRYATEVVADEVSFGGGGSKENTSSTAGGPPSPKGNANEPYIPTPYFTQSSLNFEEIPNDEGLPF